MIISKNSQLGLRLWDYGITTQYLSDTKALLDREAEYIDVVIDGVKNEYELNRLERTVYSNDLFKEISSSLGYKPENKGSEFYTVKHPNTTYFLVRESVWICSKMIRISEDFSCSIFNKIKDGSYMYLLGKDEFYHFLKFNGVLRAGYWNKSTGVAFELGFHLIKDEYYYPRVEEDKFNDLVRLMIFIELGDIEIETIESGRNNGKSKKSGKITNTSDFKVYVVDSSWNKIIIRTDGFAVRGHFRLQPCGEGHKDRKLVWIDAFEKHGYKRARRAEIIN